MRRDTFVDLCEQLLASRHLTGELKDRNHLYDIFDSMDFDSSGVLSCAEWAGGLTVFFKGSQEECVRAAVGIVGKSGSGALSQSEMQDYLGPFLKAVTPEGTSGLRPILLQKAADRIWKDIGLDSSDSVSAEELTRWSKAGNNIMDILIETIEKEVTSLRAVPQ